MPALDSCHQQMVNALIKAGWNVNTAPVYLRAEKLVAIPDIQATLNNGSVQQIIVVEVKCFLDERLDQDELYRAIGQYLVYRQVLRTRQLDIPLYLAIAIQVYQRLFVKQVVNAIIHESRLKLIVVDLEREEVIQWLE